MKRLMVTVLLLALLAFGAWAEEEALFKFAGSTTAAGIVNADQQRMEIDQVIDIDIAALHLDLDGGFDYNFDPAQKFWNYDVGGSYALLKNLKLGGSVVGNQDLNLKCIDAFADFTLGKVGADFDILFSADKTKDVFQGLDVSAFYANDWVHIRVGWLFTENGAPDINAPELFTDGGVYAKVKVSY